MGEADGMIPIPPRYQKGGEMRSAAKQESGNRVERGSVSDEWVSAWDNRRAGQPKAERIRDETRRDETRRIKPSLVDEMFSLLPGITGWVSDDGRSPSGTASQDQPSPGRACRFQKEKKEKGKAE